MTKLSDLQCILLSAASQRDNGNIYPLPATVDPRGGAKAVGALLRRGLVEQRTGEADSVQTIYFINGAGLTAIGIEPDLGAQDVAESGSGGPHLPRQTKAVLVLALLERPEGAVMAELTEATGWLPHTVRAALTGLRKKGHGIDRTTRYGKTCYRSSGAAR